MLGNSTNPRQVTLIDIQRLSPLCNKPTYLIFFHYVAVYYISPPLSIVLLQHFFIITKLLSTPSTLSPSHPLNLLNPLNSLNPLNPLNLLNPSSSQIPKS